jgi:hypothetical protein
MIQLTLLITANSLPIAEAGLEVFIYPVITVDWVSGRESKISIK